MQNSKQIFNGGYINFTCGFDPKYSSDPRQLIRVWDDLLQINFLPK